MQEHERVWRVGVIGAGKHGSRYARHIVQDVDGLALTAISRRSEEGRNQAGSWSCRWHVDWRQLVADPEVDCIVAALPPVLNTEVAAACARAGKPLLLEKPMAVSVQAAEQIRDLFNQSGVALTIGQTLRYNSVILSLRQQLTAVGQLASFTANQRLEPAPRAWLDDPAQAGAGVSFHSAVHVFDALRFVTGHEIVRVLARTRCVHSCTLEDHLLALVELNSGVIGTVDCSKIGPARSGRFEFVGSVGQLHADQVHHTGELILGSSRTPLHFGAPVSTIVPLLRDWLAFLQGRQPNPIPPGEGVAAVRVCEACLRSDVKGGWEKV
jgi:predicted dehydrogenase